MTELSGKYGAPQRDGHPAAAGARRRAMGEDVAGTIHAHPTLGEAVQEAALRALGHALHI